MLPVSIINLHVYLNLCPSVCTKIENPHIRIRMSVAALSSSYDKRGIAS